MKAPFALRTAQQLPVESFDWGQLHWYAGAALDNADGVTVGRCILKPARGNPIHHHPNCEEVLHVLSGSIEHYIEGRGWFPMLVGDTITIAPNIRHGARNTGATEAHLLICFSSANRQTIGEDVDPGR